MVQPSLLRFFPKKKTDSRSTPNKRRRIEGESNADETTTTTPSIKSIESSNLATASANNDDETSTLFSSPMTPPPPPPPPSTTSSMEHSNLATASASSGDDERTIVHPSTAVTPPSTTATATMETAIRSITENNNVIDLVSDDDDTGCSTERRLRFKSDKVVKGEPTERIIGQESNNDDDCLVVAAPCCIKDNKATSAGTLISQTEEDDIAFVGATAPNALEHFPHSRQDCVIHPLTNGTIANKRRDYCTNCYCYVCDIPASQCRSWYHHFDAKSGVALWETKRQKERQTRKRNATKRKPRKQNATTTATTTTTAGLTQPQRVTLAALMTPPPPSISAPHPRRVSLTPPARSAPRPSWASGVAMPHISANTITQPPWASGVVTTQHQSVTTQSGMVCTTTPPARSAPRPSWESGVAMPLISANTITRLPWASGAVTTQHQTVTTQSGMVCTTTRQDASSVQALILQEATRNYPVEASPPPDIFTTTLRPYQRQSLAFMKDVEAGNEVSTGGWLASEVGMGKSAIVLALVASDLVHPIHPLQLKTTVILTSVSLMGQWEDEVQKHAPGLKVRRFHPPSRSKVPLNLREPECHWEGELPTVDVLISTATFAWPTNVTKDYMFHRVVMDEAHLFASPRAANINHANQIKARRKWCVTATPCSNSIYDLSLQVCFLGQSHLGSALMRAQKSMCAGGSKPSIQVCNHEVAQQFSKYMIRHEKSQLLGDGSEALSLPPTVTKVVTLQMTPAERFIFQTKLHQSVGARLRQYQTSGIGIFPLEQQVLQPLCSNSLFSNWRESSKIGALLQDIASLQKEDFNLRAVVFTQYTHTHGEVVKALRAFFGIPVVYELTGSTSATNRDFAIRAFQGPRTFPAVIVVTLRAGSVGMTLTNASRLYLMEPSIDSAAELQAMGRIHRLGQDRPVQVTKFVQADTVEANLLELHKEIQAGRIAPIQNNHVPGTAVTILARNLLL